MNPCWKKKVPISLKKKYYWARNNSVYTKNLQYIKSALHKSLHSSPIHTVCHFSTSSLLQCLLLPTSRHSVLNPKPHLFMIPVGNISLHFQKFLLPLTVKIQWDLSQCSTQRSDLTIIQSIWNYLKNQKKKRRQTKSRRNVFLYIFIW